MTAHMVLYKGSVIFKFGIIIQISITKTKRVLYRVQSIFAAFGTS